MTIELSNVSCAFDSLVVLDHVDLTIQEGRVTALLGPSGCGKTTLLNIVAGTVEAQSGKVIGCGNRTLSYVYQEPRLMPWKTVSENLRFVLENAVPGTRVESIIGHALSVVGLEDFKDYYPHELSGGMKQRVALARAFAFPSDLLLMDEPFQGLDLKTKASLARYFSRSWADEPRTTVYVTHDIQEALLIGDIIHVLSERPAWVHARLEIALPRDSRNLTDEELISAERELYKLLS